MTNTMIARGTSEPAEILRSVKDGVFVKKMGGGQVDVVSGNFAFEITECYRIRDGKLAEPLRGATLVGQGPKLMSEIDMVGSDLDRKSTRLNSSHSQISYAVFCLKK